MLPRQYWAFITLPYWGARHGNSTTQNTSSARINVGLVIHESSWGDLGLLRPRMLGRIVMSSKSLITPIIAHARQSHSPISRESAAVLKTVEPSGWEYRGRGHRAPQARGAFESHSLRHKWHAYGLFCRFKWSLIQTQKAKCMVLQTRCKLDWIGA